MACCRFKRDTNPIKVLGMIFRIQNITLLSWHCECLARQKIFMSLNHRSVTVQTWWNEYDGTKLRQELDINAIGHLSVAKFSDIKNSLIVQDPVLALH